MRGKNEQGVVMAKRVFLIVLDSFGIGAAPDAIDYGDVGANTLKRISKSNFFDAKNLASLGLGNIEGVDCVKKTDRPLASVARLRELSKGKDTTIGHWELMGIISERPLPTYPDGFPSEIIEEFEKATAKGVLCNKTYSGTEVIKDYGKEHEKTGKLIVYTSADSVFQIAAHESVVPVKELYAYCQRAREILTGKHGVGRVIARPFITEGGKYKRTANRRDFSLLPPEKTALDAIKEKGMSVIAIGKITDIFANQGITESIKTHGNTDGIEKTVDVMKRNFEGLCFTNLVDFDMLYGHRNDAPGYAKALSEFDLWLGEFIKEMTDSDLLMITADHGCDPLTESTDHSREYTPLLVYGKKVKNINLGTRESFADIGKTIADIFGINSKISGNSFKDEILES